MLFIHHTDTDPHSYEGHDNAGAYASDKWPVLKIGLSTWRFTRISFNYFAPMLASHTKDTTHCIPNMHSW